MVLSARPSSTTDSVTASNSSADSTLSISRIKQNFLPSAPMPSKYSVLTRVPNGGVSSISSAERSITWLTESARTPMVSFSPWNITSVMMMQENFVTRLDANPNFTARSTTGTTLPRRLVTPRIQVGVLGTVVTASYSTISLTFTMLIAYSSPAVKKVRYCTVLGASWLFSWFDAPIVSRLGSLPLVSSNAYGFPIPVLCSHRLYLERSEVGFLRGLAVGVPRARGLSKVAAERR